jgi:hypothetical protein
LIRSSIRNRNCSLNINVLELMLTLNNLLNYLQDQTHTTSTKQGRNH